MEIARTIEPGASKKILTDTETNTAGACGALHRMPESFSAFCKIVSLTAANTSRMFVVSVACVRLEK